TVTVVGAVMPPRYAPGTNEGSGLSTRPLPAKATCALSGTLRETLLQVLVERREELLGRLPLLVGADEHREVLGHLARLDGLHHDILEGLGEGDEGLIAVELAAVHEPAGPRIDRGDRVGRGGLARLVLAVMPRDRAVRGFRLDDLAVGSREHRGHEAERAVTLRDGVGLHIAVVVLAGPDVAALPLERRGDHVVDEAVLVGEAGRLELVLVLGVEDLLEEVLEAAVIGLEDGVLRREVHGVAAV